MLDSTDLTLTDAGQLSESPLRQIASTSKGQQFPSELVMDTHRLELRDSLRPLSGSLSLDLLQEVLKLGHVCSMR